MAHSDCSYCGAYGGINYGVCTNCTPKPLLEAKEKLKQARAAAIRDLPLPKMEDKTND